MFGYVRPPLEDLPPEETERFRQAYCGLCHTLAKRHGLAARFILNYDFTFLAILLSQREAAPTACARCPASPLRRRSFLEPDAAMELAADESVILAYWQLRDGVADHGFWKSLLYRLLSRLLYRAYRRAAALRPEFDRTTRLQLDKLAQLETDRIPALDPAADAFAILLSAAAEEVDDPVRRRVLEQLLYHLGRWVYLIDAADDLQKDAASGNYNPVALRYGLNGGEPACICQHAGSLHPYDDHRVRAGGFWLLATSAGGHILSRLIPGGPGGAGRHLPQCSLRKR